MTQTLTPKQRRFFAAWSEFVRPILMFEAEKLRHHLISLHTDSGSTSIHDLTDSQLADLTAKVEALTTPNEGAF